MELVRGAAEVLARQAADLRSDLFGKACGGVQPCADGRAAKCKLPQRRKRQPDQLRIALEAAAPAGDLLRERNGRGVLQVGAPGLDDALIFGLEALERVDQLRQRGQNTVLERADGRDMQGCGERVVRGLRAVDVIIRVQQPPPASSLPRFAMTSFTFMFVCVPEPVCQTTSGKWSASFPEIISSAAAQMALHFLPSWRQGTDGRSLWRPPFSGCRMRG